LKRFWALDGRAYESGALDEKTLEFMGLTTSMVLKCDDCVTYHLIRLIQLGASNEELYEALNVSLIVGGSITIPHIRRAFETIDSCRELQKTDPKLKALL
jgi:AhpD family alkylhydroperoxidase